MNYPLQRFSRVFALALAAGLSWAGPADGGQPAGGTWIDVRSPEEYAAGHVAGAVNVPHDEIVAGVSGMELGADEPIYLYCRSGRRSGLARRALVEAGFTRVVNVGGLDEARAAAAAPGPTD